MALLIKRTALSIDNEQYLEDAEKKLDLVLAEVLAPAPAVTPRVVAGPDGRPRVMRQASNPIPKIAVHSEIFADDFTANGRGERYEIFAKREVEIISLAEMFARRVTSGHNKNVIFILFGEVGSGKSMSLLSLATDAAKWLAYIKGGKPEDYFTLEKNVSVIDAELLAETLTGLLPYNVYILDDAGPGYDARSFMSKQNRELGHILQTCRTAHNILLISAPYGAMIDITAHRLAQYYGEVSEVRHDAGLSFLKVFRVIKAFRDKKLFYVYMTKSGTKITRFAAALPDPELKAAYDIVRDQKAREIMQRKNERKAAEEAARRPRGRPPLERPTVPMVGGVEGDATFPAEDGCATATDAGLAALGAGRTQRPRVAVVVQRIECLKEHHRDEVIALVNNPKISGNQLHQRLLKLTKKTMPKEIGPIRYADIGDIRAEFESAANSASE